jgi:hypothetical protein
MRYKINCGRPQTCLTLGRTDSEIRGQLRARRWRQIGRAIVLHNGVPSVSEWRRIALVNTGPRSALTAFTAAEELGLRSRERDEIHVLVPGGTRVPQLPDISLRLHYVGAWKPSEIIAVRDLHRPAPALVRAASTGRRRYVDAEWITRTGRRAVAEVDGALHLAPRRWWEDQLRQNELVIPGDLVLRFPTVVFRYEDAVVADQLRRTLLL